MQQLWGRILLLLPILLTAFPFPETVLSMYYLAPAKATAMFVFVLAWAVSCIQLLYQYWGIGEIERLAQRYAPARTSKFEDWIGRQSLICTIRQKTSLALFVFGLIPGVRPAGVALWRDSKHVGGGYLIALGTAVQLAIMFAIALGLGEIIKLIKSLFS